MKRKKIFQAFIIFLVFACISTDLLAITPKEYAVIINLAGRQRMLTQKMSKEMLLVAVGVDVEKNRSELKKTANLFDVTLKGLIKGDKKLGLPPTTNKKTLSVLNKVKNLWKEFKSGVDTVIAGGNPAVANIAQLNLPLLKKMNTAVRLYEKEASKVTGKAAGIVINLSGKQRMLTQKMSKEMLLVALNEKRDQNKSGLKKTASLFGRTLKGLRDGDKDLDLPVTKDSAIIAQLDVVKALWSDFKPVIDKVTDIDATGVSQDEIENMATLNLPLLKEMNKAVKMYEEAEK